VYLHDRELLVKFLSSQTNHSAESTENWCADGLLNFEEPFSGLEEPSFNLVSYSAKTNYVQYVRDQDTLLVQSP